MLMSVSTTTLPLAGTVASLDAKRSYPAERAVPRFGSWAALECNLTSMACGVEPAAIGARVLACRKSSGVMLASGVLTNVVLIGMVALLSRSNGLLMLLPAVAPTGSDISDSGLVSCEVCGVGVAAWSFKVAGEVVSQVCL